MRGREIMGTFPLRFLLNYISQVVDLKADLCRLNGLQPDLLVDEASHTFPVLGDIKGTILAVKVL
jgi:hypothetical protein